MCPCVHGPIVIAVVTPRDRQRGLAHHPLRPRLVQQHAQPLRVFLAGDQITPAEEIVEAERAFAPTGSADIVRSDGDHCGLHLGGVGEQRPLGEPEVRQSQRGECAGEPGLGAQPGDRVGAVVDLVHHRAEFAAGAERSAHTLDEHVIAARGVDRTVQCGEGPAAAVRSADQQGACRRVGLRHVVVGDQVDAVAHRNPQPPIHDNVVGGRGQAEQLAQRAPGELRTTPLLRGSGRGFGCSAHLRHATQAGTHPVRLRARPWSSASRSPGWRLRRRHPKGRPDVRRQARSTTRRAVRRPCVVRRR